MSLKRENIAAPHIRFETVREKTSPPYHIFFLHFHPFYAHKKHVLKQNQPWFEFFGRSEGSNFSLNSGRVATAYSTDKYKYQNHENKSQLNRAIY